MQPSWQRRGNNPIRAEHQPAPSNKSRNHFSPMRHQLSHFEVKKISTNTEVKTRRQECIYLKTCGLTDWACVKTQIKSVQTKTEIQTKQMEAQCHEICGLCPERSIKGFVQNITFWDFSKLATLSYPWRTKYH